MSAENPYTLDLQVEKLSALDIHFHHYVVSYLEERQQPVCQRTYVQTAMQLLSALETGAIRRTGILHGHVERRIQEEGTDAMLRRLPFIARGAGLGTLSDIVTRMRAISLQQRFNGLSRLREQKAP